MQKKLEDGHAVVREYSLTIVDLPLVCFVVPLSSKRIEGIAVLETQPAARLHDIVFGKVHTSPIALRPDFERIGI